MTRGAFLHIHCTTYMHYNRSSAQFRGLNLPDILDLGVRGACWLWGLFWHLTTTWEVAALHNTGQREGKRLHIYRREGSLHGDG